MFYRDLKTKREVLLNYISKNPNATYRQIRKDIKIKAERVFSGGLREAYREVGVAFSKSLSKRSREKQIKEVIDFIRENPRCSVTDIQNATKVHIPRVFGTITNAYKAAGVNYPSRNNIENALKFIKENPLASSVDISKKCGVDIYKYFRDIKEFYKKAGVEYISGPKKRLIKKQNRVIEYIKSHPKSTQWEINKECSTHVQEIFKGGIKEAYNKAGVRYPNRRIYGIMDKDIKNRALEFEDEIVDLLRGFGSVRKYFRTKKGVADAFVKIGDRNYIVEIKDYQSKPVSLSNIKQLNNYITNTDSCNHGLLICRFKGKKDKFYIGDNKIFILTKEDILRGDIAQSG